MTDRAVVDLLDAYREAPTLRDAEQVLGELDRSAQPGETSIGDLYDNLAELAADEDDFDLAIRAQRRALALGCEMPTLGREMLGWYLMKGGQRAAGEAEFAALRRERSDDPELLITLGNARSDAGDEPAALAAFDDALALAKSLSDKHAIDRARSERKASREALGLIEDADDLATPRPRIGIGEFEELTFAVGWFPRDQHAAALERWPDLDEDLEDADVYCRRIERHLHELAQTTRRHPFIAPLTVQTLLAYAERDGLDAGDGETRASFAATLHRHGETIPWPPGRNDPCWCRSGRKYKRCCGV